MSEKRPVGRPRLPPEQKVGNVVIFLRCPPAMKAWIEKNGGSIFHRKLLEKEMKKENG